MNKVQIIKDKNGKAEYAVLPYEEYQRLIALDENNYKPIPYEADDEDNETIPHEVVSIMVDKNISLLAAWREFRGLSQYDIAEVLGINQSAVSQFEKPNSKPQKKTREKLAKLYDCKPEQLVL